VDEERAAEDESEWRRVPLPEWPRPGSMRRWASRQPVFVLLAQLVAPAVLLLARPLGFGPAAVPVLLIALLGTITLATAARRLDVALRARARDRSPLEPWIQDHAWDERGETRTWFVRMADAVSGRGGWRRYAVFVLVMLAMVLGVGRVEWAGTACFGAAVTILALAAWRIHGIGDSHLTFTKFPFHPGEPLTLYFRMSEGGAQFRRVEFCIAHVQEFAGGTLNLQRGTRRLFTGFDTRPPGPLPGPDYDVELTFDVPESAPGTRISDRFPRYWRLEVRGATTSGPYTDTFLVPIYARPSAPAAGGGTAPARDPSLPA
jgi:hypothetical protein